MLNLYDPNQTPLAPDFDHPIEMLEACHDKIRHFCHQLASLPAHLRANGVNQQIKNTITQTLRYFDTAAPLHHADEEQQLFPALLAQQPQLAPSIERFTAQHLEFTLEWHTLREQLLEVYEGRERALNTRRVTQFARRYRRHADEEESQLFMYAPQWLHANTLYDIGQHMRQRRQQ